MTRTLTVRIAWSQVIAWGHRSRRRRRLRRGVRGGDIEPVVAGRIGLDHFPDTAIYGPHMLGDRAAIDAARAFLLAREQWPWDERTIEVHAEMIEGRPTWVVWGLDALEPGEADWMRGNHEPLGCFVDMVTGEVFGYEIKRSRTFLRRHLP